MISTQSCQRTARSKVVKGLLDKARSSQA